MMCSRQENQEEEEGGGRANAAQGTGLRGRAAAGVRGQDLVARGGTKGRARTLPASPRTAAQATDPSRLARGSALSCRKLSRFGSREGRWGSHLASRDRCLGEHSRARRDSRACLDHRAVRHHAVHPHAGAVTDLGATDHSSRADHDLAADLRLCARATHHCTFHNIGLLSNLDRVCAGLDNSAVPHVALRAELHVSNNCCGRRDEAACLHAWLVVRQSQHFTMSRHCP
eukprot:1567689-Rhodomonas_salina.1